MKEEVYIEQPYGYKRKSSERLVCKLHKAVYGLKQAARCWNETLTELLNSLGLGQFSSEECIYASKGNELIVGAYVDDLLIISASNEIVENFKKLLSEKVRLTDNGNLKKFVGISVERTGSELKLSQKEMIYELIESCDLLNANGVRTPLATGSVLDAEETDEPCKYIKKYQSLVGSLMYIAGCTRPDIQFVANHLGKYMANPMEKHLCAAKRVVRYLKRTANAQLIFKKKLLK